MNNNENKQAVVKLLIAVTAIPLPSLGMLNLVNNSKIGYEYASKPD